MPEMINKVVVPLKARWDTLTRPQQYKLLGVILVVLLAIILASYFAFRTRFTVLVANRDWMEITPMTVALTAEGIRHRTDQGGTALEVDSRRLEDARSIITHQQLAPADERFTWADALDTGFGTTDAERRQRMLLGVTGDIERMILDVQGITAVSVNLTNPPVRPFERDAPGPDAAVMITTTRDFPPHEGRNIAMMVSRSVAGLELSNVVIMDQFARTIFSSDMDTQGDPVGGVQEARNQFTNTNEWALQRMFLHIFDDVSAVVSYQFDDRMFEEEMREVFRVPEGQEEAIPWQRRDMRASMEGAPAGMEPGLGANIPQMPAYAMPGGGVISAEQRESEFQAHVDRITTLTQMGPGWFIPERSSAAIVGTLVRDVHQGLWMADAPEGETRTQQDWERFRAENSSPVLVADFEFSDVVRESAARAAGIPVDNVALIVMEQIFPIDIERTPLPWPLLVMLGVLALLLAMLMYGLLYKEKPVADGDVEPELSVEDLLVSTQLEEEKEEEAQEIEAIEYFKDNELKKQIEKFVNERPDAAAALLRNWINSEEW